jgi:hypothetical protein
MRPAQSTQFSDLATARFIRLMAQMRFERSSYFCPNRLLMLRKFFDSSRSNRFTGSALASSEGARRVRQVLVDALDPHEESIEQPIY